MKIVVRLMLAFSVCAVAGAATLQQLSMDQMARSATAIVRARVTGSSVSFTGATIYTHYTLQISETWKGSPGTEVMLPGGTAAGYRQSFPGVPELRTGSEYVLFLWTSSLTGITHLVGLSQGVFNVTAQGDGSTNAVRPAIGEGVLDLNGRRVRDRGMQMSLTGMKATVSAALAAVAVK